MSHMTHTERHNHEVETAVLAAFMCDWGYVRDALDLLKPNDFYFEKNKYVAQACYRLAKKSVPVDIVTLMSELTESGNLLKAGGYERIYEISSSYYTSANVMHHAREVKRLSEARNVVDFANKIVRGEASPTVHTLREAADKMGKPAALANTGEAMKHYDDFDDGLDTVQPSISTGFHTLDKKAGGFATPSVAVLGAYSSTGKTAFALNVAAHQDEPVVFFSLEMGAAKIIERLASAQLNINYNKFRTRGFEAGEREEILGFTKSMRGRGMYIFDNVYFAEQMVNVVSSIRPKLVVVDYLQLVRTHHRADKRLEIDHVSQLFQKMSKECNCSVILLSQFARPNKGLKKYVPNMNDLKESGGIENDADYVCILHRPYVLNKHDKSIREEDGYLLLDKNRYGETGKFDLEFVGKYQKFYEVDKRLEGKYSSKLLPSGGDG